MKLSVTLLLCLLASASAIATTIDCRGTHTEIREDEPSVVTPGRVVIRFASYPDKPLSMTVTKKKRTRTYPFTKCTVSIYETFDELDCAKARHLRPHFNDHGISLTREYGPAGWEKSEMSVFLAKENIPGKVKGLFMNESLDDAIIFQSCKVTP